MKAGEITVKVNLEMMEDAKDMIRQIVREEIAAHLERLEMISPRMKLDGEAIAAALGEHLRKRRESNGETWLDGTP